VSVIEDVRAAVIAIPAGFVASYGDIGKRIGAGPRQVGRAMSLLDDSVPWWRVVYADGTPASCHGGRAPGLLNDEGTPMLGARVNMKRARQTMVPDDTRIKTDGCRIVAVGTPPSLRPVAQKTTSPETQ
jgi:alkylated DNA nucleotide flippase Atl1